MNEKINNRELFNNWITELVLALNKGDVVRKNNCKCAICSTNENPFEPSIQVTDRLFENALIIDSSSFVKYFKAIVEPGYLYTNALLDAEAHCEKFIKQWLGLD